MSAFKETMFLENWIAGVKLAGPSLFGEGSDPDLASSKWDLRPRLADVERRILTMSRGEAVFLAAMVCFYNDEDGALLLKKVIDQHDFGICTVAASLDEVRRAIIADLFATYSGW
jgi:hypothetical protein